MIITETCIWFCFRFRSCLKMADTSAADFVGKLFFNSVQTKCFVLKPESICLKKTWWGHCLEYEYRKVAVMKDNQSYWKKKTTMELKWNMIFGSTGRKSPVSWSDAGILSVFFFFFHSWVFTILVSWVPESINFWLSVLCFLFILRFIEKKLFEYFFVHCIVEAKTNMYVFPC